MKYNPPLGGGADDPYIDGNPGAGIEGSTVPAAAVEYTQREIVNAITAAGLAPTNGDETQLTQAIPVLAAGSIKVGQCKLVLAGGNLVMLPKGGNGLVCAGFVYTISAAGVSLAPTGLAPGLYYIYAYRAAGAWVLEAVATGHVTDTTAGNIGVEIKNGDSSRSLVGAWAIVAGPVWSATPTAGRGWFNRRSAAAQSGSIAGSTGSGAPFEITDSSDRIPFFTWGDEAVGIRCGGFANNGSSLGISAQCFIDGAAVGDYNSTGGSGVLSTGAFADAILAEGLHEAGFGIGAPNGGTTNCSMQVSVTVGG